MPLGFAPIKGGVAHVVLAPVPPLHVVEVRRGESLAATAPDYGQGTLPVFVCPGSVLVATGVTVNPTTGIVTSFFKAKDTGATLLRAFIKPSGPVEIPVLALGIEVAG